MEEQRREEKWNDRFSGTWRQKVKGCKWDKNWASMCTKLEDPAVIEIASVTAASSWMINSTEPVLDPYAGKQSYSLKVKTSQQSRPSLPALSNETAFKMFTVHFGPNQKGLKWQHISRTMACLAICKSMKVPLLWTPCLQIMASCKIFYAFKFYIACRRQLLNESIWTFARNQVCGAAIYNHLLGV